MPLYKRYEYGKLRLFRIIWIYRLSWSTLSIIDFVRGYFYNYDSYGSFLARNTTWLLAVVIYARAPYHAILV